MMILKNEHVIALRHASQKDGVAKGFILVSGLAASTTRCEHRKSQRASQQRQGARHRDRWCLGRELEIPDEVGRTRACGIEQHADGRWSAEDRRGIEDAAVEAAMRCGNEP
jgi:hypothetical protein